MEWVRWRQFSMQRKSTQPHAGHSYPQRMVPWSQDQGKHALRVADAYDWRC